MSKKREFMWKSAFRKELDERAFAFSASFPVDREMWREEIVVSLAHALMLKERRIVPERAGERLIEGLVGLYRDLEAGRLCLEGEYEDIHSFVESQLADRIGEDAGFLHTARSRNDLVVTDFRLWCRRAVRWLAEGVWELQRNLLARSRGEVRTIVPGFTHLQHAQPVTLAHNLMAYFWSFERDQERLKRVLTIINRSPLGAAALAGTPLDIDPQKTANLLGLERVMENSMDAVSDRDFALELTFICALISVHLSRLAADLILWATPEFGFVIFDEGWSTGSSIMPQKRNPDMAEHIRGRTSRIIGRVGQLLSLLKGLPLTYNSDLQEDKEATFDAVKTVAGCLAVASGIVATLTFDRDRMLQSTLRDGTVATDLADYLVKKGVPFRTAHRIVGKMVADLREKGKAFEDVTLEEFQRYHPAFDDGVRKVLEVERRVGDRVQLGGPSPRAIGRQFGKAERCLKRTEEWLRRFPDISDTLKRLLSPTS